MKSVRNKKEVKTRRRNRTTLGLQRREWDTVALILAIKALILCFGVQSFYVFKNSRPAGLYGWLEIWNRWDAPHYLSLAQNGYSATGDTRFFLVFYPLFPWMTRLFAFITGDYLVSVFIVSGVASVAAGVLLQRLVQQDFPARFAQRTVWFLFIFPTSYFLHIGYTESLFLALVLASFLAAREGRWELAGLFGAFAGLTRPNGLILIPALLTEAFMQYRADRQWQWRWLWIAVAGCGFCIYLLLNVQVAGDPFAFSALMKEHWYKSLTWPWAGIRETMKSIWGRSPAESQMVGLQEFIFIALGLASTIWCWTKLRRPAYGVWMAGNWLLFTSSSFILSAPRYTLTMFPIYILFAKLSLNRFWGSLITAWSLLFLAFFASLFVQGNWAF